VTERDVGRIAAFTDGVMAVAITLLVLNLEVPQLASGEEGRLDDELEDLLPSLAAYALSFALVGRFWVVHHRLFETLRTFDSTLMTLNLVFLALIALVPFSTDLFDTYTDEPIANAVLGATLGFAALAHWGMTAHTLRRDLVHDHHRSATEPFGGPAALAFAAFFFASVPIAYLSTLAAQALWVATIGLHHPVRRIRRRG
jgi:uncharacterized membrane protein